MKSFYKIILTVVFAISIPVSIFSQSSGIRVLPQAGLNFTKLTDDPIDKSDEFRLGAEAGLWIQTKNPVFFKPGLFYGQQGFKKLGIEDVSSINKDTVLSKIDYRYIKAPILFGIQVFGARIYTGPTFTYIIDSDKPKITEEALKDFSVGLSVGAGLNISFFSFDARYEYGITHTFSDKSSKSNVLTITAGFNF